MLGTQHSYRGRVTMHARPAGPGAEASRRGRRQGGAKPQPAGPDPILALQGLAGNAAVGRALARKLPAPRAGAAPDARIELTLEGMPHPLAEQLARHDVHARMPNFTDLKAAYTSKKLGIPESVIKEKVAQLLGRMQREKRLRSSDPIPTIVAKIFPGPGQISEKEFTTALDVSDRTVIYQTVLDAETTVKKADRAKLAAAMKDARDLIGKVEGDSAGLTAVFGAKATLAKTRYAAAKAALVDAAAHMDRMVSTDYNLDDPEMGLGGWAVPGHMHLLVDIVKVVDPAETKSTLIHEAAHQADGSVVDLGYYASPGFEGMTEDEKINNAAHFEELPRRILGKSRFPTHTFTPGAKVGGGALTADDIIHRVASEKMRKAWDAAADAFMFLRGVRKAMLRGDKTPFTDHDAMINQISQVADLTIHQQKIASARVTSLDVTLIESIARATSLIGGLTDAETVPSGPYTHQGAADVMIDAAAARYGRLLGDPVKDRAVINWFFTHYKGIPVL